MPVPDFSPGEVLTAAAMDSIGLWLVKTVTIGSGVASVPVTDAFSSTYDNYLITMSNGSMSTANTINIQIGAVVTSYRWQFIYGNWAGSALATGTVTGTNFQYCGSGNSDGLHMNCTVMSPNLPKGTKIVSDASASGSFSGNMTGLLPTTTQYTDFTVIPNSGTLTGGTIRVYGYRN